MKAERRHELETNSLALWLRFRAPELAQKHGAKILLGVIIVILAIVLIRQRMEAPRRAASSAAAYLVSAREQIDQLRSLRRVPGDAGVIATQIKTAMERSDDPQIQAEAHVAYGDYYWALASWPELPAATTQPQLRPADPQEELLKRAEEAYQRALKTPGVKPHLAAAAHFGLAAIAENRAFELQQKSLGKGEIQNPHWATAKEHYDAIVNGAGVPEILKDDARAKGENLNLLQQPVWLVPATQPTTQATTQAATQSTTVPAISSTAPTTRPVQ